MVEQKEFKYYAFISYSRKNSKAAAYLHKQLEHFRIPVKYVAEENRPPKQKFLRPIFRDRRDLEANENSFTEDIKKALEQSRYLIVLCSPESAQSNWVEKEVKHFLKTHNQDYRLIVPVVLSGEPNCKNETECLPPALRLEEIVSRNLPSMMSDEREDEKTGWLTGVVQSMSYMLKVNREKIRATIDAEKVRQAKIYTIIGVVCTLIFAGLAFWAIKSERDLREKNEQLEYVNFINEYTSDIESLCVDSSYRSMFSLLDYTNNTSVVTQECVLKFVKKYGDSRLAGPEITKLMLKAMSHNILDELNEKMDYRKRITQSLIFLRDKKARICQELGANNLVMTEGLKQIEEIEAKEKTLESYVKELDLKIASLERVTQIVRGDNDLHERVGRIEKSLKDKEYVVAMEIIKAWGGTFSLLSKSAIAWNIIRDAPVDHDKKIFFSLSERHRLICNWQKVKEVKDKVNECKKYPFLVSQWDFRIAELYGEIGNYKEVVKYIEDALSILFKCDFYQQEAFSSVIPHIGGIYKNVDSSDLELFFKDNEKRKIAQQIFSLYRMLLVKNMLPIVLAHENSYLSWYVYGRRDELVETYKFHEKLCEFVEFDNNMKIAEPIRNVLSELKRDLEHGLDCVTQSDMQCDQFNLGVNFEDLLLLQGAISYINELKFNRALSIIRILRKQKSRCFLVRVLDVIEAGCRNKELLSNGLIVCGYMASNSQYSILKIGDVIKEVNGKPCKNYADVRYKDGSVYTIYRLNNKGDFEKMKVTISKNHPVMVFMAL